MKIAIIGLWHLGCVTAACLAAAGHDVLAYDPDPNIIKQLQQGEPPLFEPGLKELLLNGVNTGKLHYFSDLQLLSDIDLVWVTFDTPVDENDHAHVSDVTQHIAILFPFLKQNTLLLISSQLPIGTTRQLQQQYATQWPQKKLQFSYIPENLRLGNAIQVLMKTDRFVVGIDDEYVVPLIKTLLTPFSSQFIWMTIESAEMTKHAINAFLATSVIFINELATLCECVGANAREVERGLKSEERIGSKAYLRPGTAIAGGTLLRDLNYLLAAGQQQQLNMSFISNLLTSNQLHKQWTCQRMMAILPQIKEKTIVSLGLTYKTGTNTLRRSLAIETCEWLHQQGANIVAYDPTLTTLPTELAQFIELKSSIEQVLPLADAIMIASDSPFFLNITPNQLLSYRKQPVVVDPSGFLLNTLGNDKRIHYFSVGSCA